MQTSTQNDRKDKALISNDEICNDILYKFKTKNIVDIKDATEDIKNQCLHSSNNFEPYLIKIMEDICKEDTYISNKNRNIRDAYSNILLLILDKINISAVTIVLSSIYKLLNHRRWEPQVYGLQCILFLSETKISAIKRNLQEIIPHVSDLMTASKQEIKELSEKTMYVICKSSENKDIEPFFDQIIKSVLMPAEVSNCVHALASTIFVQKVESPALAIVEPLLIRGIKENKIAMKRKVASIVDNMLVLIDNPCEGSPFIERVLPGLEKAADNITDMEAKGVIDKALKSLKDIEKQLLEYKSLTPDVILKIIQKECCFEDIIDLNTLTTEYVSTMCSQLVNQRIFDKKVWDNTIMPYFEFTDKASLICDKIFNTCLKESKPVEMQEDVDEEGEDLCNCQFTLGYAAKVLLSNTRLHLKRGKRYGLCGPNDCGKSTLMRSIANGQLEGFPPANELKTVYVEHDIQGVEDNTPVLDFVFMDENCKHVDKQGVIDVLESVGFSKTEVSKGASQLMPTTSLSGGWKML